MNKFFKLIFPTIIYLATSGTFAQINQSIKDRNFPVARNGVYEIAEVLRWAMVRNSKENTELNTLQEYNFFKGIIKNIKPGDHLARYRGEIILGTAGRPAIASNITDEYEWSVLIDGPNAGASYIQFTSGFLDPKIDVGPVYLRKNNFNIIPLICFSDGRSSANAEALYLVRVPGRTPTLLQYEVSTGSGGTLVQYKIHYSAIAWNEVPGAGKREFDGRQSKFGECPYEDLR